MTGIGPKDSLLYNERNFIIKISMMDDFQEQIFSLKAKIDRVTARV
jgi:hypothetical protein